MRADRLKRLDPWLGLAARPLGWLLSRLCSARDPSDRPLVVRPGGMGDLICVCMAIEGLGGDPRGFRWLIEERSRPWADHLGLDHLCYDAGPLRVLWGLAGRHGVVINSEQRYGLAQAAALAAAARSARLTCFQTNRGRRWADRVVAYAWDRGHEVTEFRRLFARALNLADPLVPPARARRHPPTAPPIVGIAGVHSESRRLDVGAWSRLVAPWAGGRPFFVVAAPGDRDLARRLAGGFPGQASPLDCGFTELCERISRAEELFTVDGGMVHIASYYGVPVTAVFTSGREGKWAPLAAGSRLIRRADLSCQPCVRFGQVPPCPRSFACKDLDYPRHLRGL